MTEGGGGTAVAVAESIDCSTGTRSTITFGACTLLGILIGAGAERFRGVAMDAGFGGDGSGADIGNGWSLGVMGVEILVDLEGVGRWMREGEGEMSRTSSAA
jgi:hypothetical protein